MFVNIYYITLQIKMVPIEMIQTVFTNPSTELLLFSTNVGLDSFLKKNYVSN